MNLFRTKTPENLDPRKTELKQIIQNTSNLFGKANTLTMTQYQDISDKSTIKFSVSTMHEGHKINIVARSQVSQKKIDVDVIIQTPQIHQLHLGDSAVKFSLPIHTPEKNIHPCIMNGESAQNKAPDGFIDMLKEIVVNWMPVIQMLETIPAWSHTIDTQIQKQSYGYIMNVKSEKFWSNPRFIELKMLSDETNILFRQGYNSDQTTPRKIKKIDLKTEILSYLDTFKWTEYGSRYEELHQRIVNLIDS